MRPVLNVKARLIRAGKCIREERFSNAVVRDGQNLLLDTMFNDSVQNFWYIGLIDKDGYTLISVNDTMAIHTGWFEWTDYDETDRPEWITDPANNGAIWTSPSSPASFTMSAAGTLKGVFLSSDDGKGGTTGFLWATALFVDGSLGEDWEVEIDDEIQIAYGVILA
jgi:hypothetical protein